MQLGELTYLVADPTKQSQLSTVFLRADVPKTLCTRKHRYDETRYRFGGNQ